MGILMGIPMGIPHGEFPHGNSSWGLLWEVPYGNFHMEIPIYGNLQYMKSLNIYACTSFMHLLKLCFSAQLNLQALLCGRASGVRIMQQQRRATPSGCRQKTKRRREDHEAELVPSQLGQFLVLSAQSLKSLFTYIYIYTHIYISYIKTFLEI